MTSSTVTAGGPRTYFVERVRFPFCKGCGHTQVLRKLNEAMSLLRLVPEDVVLVTDIGCIGLADGLFADIHTVHTTHGRSTAFATGIALADTILASGKLNIVVLIGDGGAMIGLQHLVHAAMLNVNITVLVCNNFVYGMTGGQGSGLTPECFVTATTPAGNPIPPADLCGILLSSNAAFVARELSTAASLAQTLRDAIAFPGFAVVEILELCTEFAVPENNLDGKKLAELAGRNGWQLGRIREDHSQSPFESRWRAGGHPKPSGPERAAEERPRSVIGREVGILIAGSAGEKVQSAAASVCRASVDLGDFATQKNDNPVTQGSGFSISEICLSPSPILYTGREIPEAIVVASEEGAREVRRRGTLGVASAGTLIVADEAIPFPDSKGVRIAKPLRSEFGPSGAAAAGLLLMTHLLRALPQSEILALAQRRFGEKSKVLEEWFRETSKS